MNSGPSTTETDAGLSIAGLGLAERRFNDQAEQGGCEH